MASPPTNKAGAILLAGFTDVPVRGIPIKWTNASVRPITIPATLAYLSSLVTPKMVKTNTIVSIISVISDKEKEALLKAPIYNLYKKMEEPQNEQT